MTNHIELFVKSYKLSEYYKDPVPNKIVEMYESEFGFIFNEIKANGD